MVDGIPCWQTVDVMLEALTERMEIEVQAFPKTGRTESQRAFAGLLVDLLTLRVDYAQELKPEKG